MARAAAEIDPVLAMASNKSTLFGPRAVVAPMRMRPRGRGFLGGFHGLRKNLVHRHQTGNEGDMSTASPCPCRHSRPASGAGSQYNIKRGSVHGSYVEGDADTLSRALEWHGPVVEVGRKQQHQPFLRLKRPYLGLHSAVEVRRGATEFDPTGLPLFGDFDNIRQFNVVDATQPRGSGGYGVVDALALLAQCSRRSAINPAVGWRETDVPGPPAASASSLRLPRVSSLPRPRPALSAQPGARLSAFPNGLRDSRVRKPGLGGCRRGAPAPR